MVGTAKYVGPQLKLLKHGCRTFRVDRLFNQRLTFCIASLTVTYVTDRQRTTE